MPNESRRAELEAAAHRRYWSGTVRTIALLLLLWAGFGLGCGVLWADALNAWSLGGFPLGFWFAQQGSLLAFLVLIGIYAVAMGRFDRRLRAELEAARAASLDLEEPRA
jgi:putative solute:sodium symporter small subunit